MKLFRNMKIWIGSVWGTATYDDAKTQRAILSTMHRVPENHGMKLSAIHDGVRIRFPKATTIHVTVALKELEMADAIESVRSIKHGPIYRLNPSNQELKAFLDRHLGRIVP